MSQPSAPVIFISAGEPSGDLHGAELARALRSRLPNARLVGLGGPRMAAEGVELLAGLEDLAVMGIFEVAAHLPFFLRLRRRVFQTLQAERVSLVIPIDYPGFNLRLARYAHGQGVPVLYYIAPQVWAWHASRARDLARDTDRIAVVLPFETAFLAKRGAAAEFVGHPLLDLPADDTPRGAWFAKQGLDPGRPLLALMPGSRAQEVRRHLETFSAAADLAAQANPGLQVLIGAGSNLPAEAYSVGGHPRTTDTHALLRHATAALIKSGTTTLETALAETPFVVAYRMNRLSFQLARRLVKVPHIALANLVANARVAPEFIQDAATPPALAAALTPLLQPENPQRLEMISRLRTVRKALGRGGAAKRVAEIAVELLDKAQASRR